MSDSVTLTTYESSKSTEFGHTHIPRFGKSNKFASLFGTEDERNDYIIGLIFAGILIITIFLVWSLLLIIFKLCLRQKKVGFLSGSPFTFPYTSKQEKDAASNSQRPIYKRPIWCRRIFMLAGITLIIFGVLLVTKGITNIHDTSLIVSSESNEINYIAEEASAIASSLKGIGQSALGIRDELSSNLGNFCPAAEGELQEQTGINFDELANEAISLLNQLGDFINDDVVEFQRTLEETQVEIQRINEINDEIIAVNDWQSLLVLIPIIIIPSLLMVGCIMAMYETSTKCYTCLLNWIFVPLFVIITFISYCGSGAVALASTLNSDWCSGNDGFGSTSKSPDGTIYEILKTLQLSQNELPFQIIRFYTTQCTSENPWSFLDGYKDELVAANTTITEFFDSLEEVTVPRLTLICGRDFGPFETLLEVMLDNLRILLVSVKSALNLIRCDRIVPIYVNLVYNGTCNYSVTGITWIWVSLLVIAFCGHVMLTLRSSMYETVYKDESPEDLAAAISADQHEQLQQHEMQYYHAQQQQQQQQYKQQQQQDDDDSDEIQYVATQPTTEHDSSEPHYYADEQHRQYANGDEEEVTYPTTTRAIGEGEEEEPEITFPPPSKTTTTTTNAYYQEDVVDDDDDEPEITFSSRTNEQDNNNNDDSVEITFSNSTTNNNNYYYEEQREEEQHQYGGDYGDTYVAAQEVTNHQQQPQPSAPPPHAQVVSVEEL